MMNLTPPKIAFNNLWDEIEWININ
jgi:hypothetical protein